MHEAYVWAWVVCINVVSLVLAVSDKRRARRGDRRIPEITFHWLALGGGGAGGLLGFLLLRHKVRKPRFLVPFLLRGVMGAGAVYLALLWRPW